MKKINQTSNILFLVALAFFAKAYMDKNTSLVLVGVILIVLAIYRRLLIKQVEKLDDEPDQDGEDSIIRYLKRDVVLYAEMIEVYRRGNCEILYDENDGILLYDHTSFEYLATASTLAGARDILLKLPMDYGMLIVHDDIFNELENKDFKFTNKLVFYNYLYEKRSLYKVVENNLTFKQLDESNLETIKEHYSVKSLCNDEYISGRIKEGMLGAFLNDELIGFIGMHDNGSIGLLEVFEEHRGKHVAILLQMMYTNQLLQNRYEGAIYSQVHADNTISRHIQNKLLLKEAKQPSYWYFSN